MAEVVLKEADHAITRSGIEDRWVVASGFGEYLVGLDEIGVEDRHRVEGGSVMVESPVEVGAGDATGGADAPYKLTALDPLAFAYLECG